jgi:hypothetical protein
MPVELPPGWVITPTLENVPDPNAGTPAARSFARWTYICTDENAQYVCSSGSEPDCETQAQTAAQCRTQQQPYYEEIP